MLLNPWEGFVVEPMTDDELLLPRGSLALMSGNLIDNGIVVKRL